MSDDLPRGYMGQGRDFNRSAGDRPTPQSPSSSNGAYPVSHGAFDFARESGIDRMASMGLGDEFINSMIRARLSTIRPQIQQARFDAGYGTMMRLGEGTISGQGGTARAAVEAYGFGQYADAILQGETANEQFRQNAQGQWMGVLTDLDARKDQAAQLQRQFEEQSKNWFDRALGVASIFV